MVFAAPAVVPPIVLPVASTITPTPLPSLSPEASVPMKLPKRRFAVAIEPEIDTPAARLLTMTFPAPAAVPPIVLSGDSMVRPIRSDPMLLPITTLPVAAAPKIDTPASLLPWMLDALIVLFADSMTTPISLISMESPSRTFDVAAAPDM